MPRHAPTARTLIAVAASTVILTTTTPMMSGCEKKGPAEKAGRDLDKAAKKTGDAVKDATGTK